MLVSTSRLTGVSVSTFLIYSPGKWSQSAEYKSVENKSWSLKKYQETSDHPDGFWVMHHRNKDLCTEQ